MEEQIFRMQLLGRESRETRDGNQAPLYKSCFADLTLEP